MIQNIWVTVCHLRARLLLNIPFTSCCHYEGSWTSQHQTFFAVTLKYLQCFFVKRQPATCACVCVCHLIMSPSLRHLQWPHDVSCWWRSGLHQHGSPTRWHSHSMFPFHIKNSLILHSHPPLGFYCEMSALSFSISQNKRHLNDHSSSH